jgi:hypothetical protein
MRDFISASFVALTASSFLACAAPTPPASPNDQSVSNRPTAKAPVAQAGGVVPAGSDKPTETADSAVTESNEPSATQSALDTPRSCEVPGEAAGNSLGSVAQGAAKPAPPQCFPSAKFVERLCAASYPGVALVMFHPESPWKRGYLKGETKAWTSTAGAQQEERLKFNEEVLVLQSNNGADGALAGQGDSFFALRWNGSCVKLTEEEITTLAPWRRLASPVQWGWLDDNIQEELLADGKVAAAQSAWKKECRKSGSPSSERCSALGQQLTDAVVARVKSGAPLPEPTNRPKVVAAK